MIDALEVREEFGQPFIQTGVLPSQDTVSTSSQPGFSLGIRLGPRTHVVVGAIDLDDEHGFWELEIRTIAILYPAVEEKRSAGLLEDALHRLLTGARPDVSARGVAFAIAAIVGVHALTAAAGAEGPVFGFVVILDELMVRRCQFSAATGAVLAGAVAAYPLLHGVIEAGAAATGAEGKVFLLDPAVVSFEILVTDLRDGLPAAAGAEPYGHRVGTPMVLEKL